MLREDASAKAMLNKWGVALPIIAGEARLAYEYTLLWDPSIPIRLELLPAGFKFLEKWDVAAPLASYDKLARDVGGKVERGRTQTLIHDLRVPLYDTRMIFIRSNLRTETLMAVWKRELRNGDHRDMAFLRAAYRTLPLILALPLTWMDKKSMNG